MLSNIKTYSQAVWVSLPYRLISHKALVHNILRKMAQDINTCTHDIKKNNYMHTLYSFISNQVHTCNAHYNNEYKYDVFNTDSYTR